MKQGRLRLCAIAAVMVVVALLATSCGAGQPQTIKIGIVMPITGPNAATTRDHINGMMVAIDDVNNAGGLLGGRKIEVIKEDDRSQPSEGVSAIRKVITQDKVVAVLGNFNSSVCAATRDVTNEYKIPQLVVGCTADYLPEGYPYLFRTNTNNSFQTLPFIRWLVRDQGRKRVAILYENTDWGRNLNDVSAKVAKQYGAEVLIQEGYNPGTTDFLAVLTKIKAVNPDLLISPALVTEAAIIVRQAKELGLDPSIIAGWGGWSQSDLHDLANGAENGVMMGDSFPATNPQTPTAKYLVEEVKKRYPDTPPSVYHAQGYEAAITLIDAIKRANSTDPQKIRDAIAATKGLAGALGTIVIDENGQNLGITIYPTQWQDGKQVIVGPGIVAGEE